MHVKVLRAEDVAHVIREVGLNTFLDGLINRLEEVFRRWRELKVVPRVSFHYASGVMEAMPASDARWYSVKIVNGHPGNPLRGLQTVVAVGVLADVETGYPVMIADATLLTALRTGATSALATKYLARRGSENLGIIGTGAQSEFLVYSISRVANSVEKVFFYDIDPKAMEKFEKNISRLGFELVRAGSPREVALNSDVLVTATTSKGKDRVVLNEWVRPGTHINAVGGDAPGKTELDPAILLRSKLVVELLEQAIVEGETQSVGRDAVYAELWEVVSGLKHGRSSEEEVTVFDSVGIAVEDLATLTYLYGLAERMQVGLDLELFPRLSDPKDLFFTLISDAGQRA
ncbi:ornithine cyclodeaminase [Thermofilum pendens]|uniref:L-alanine dehydrogenase n=1 Tax=Thermofilum pendens (strain DSM 2475 / Hrk 5) TaxID=368408 RepID=A1RWN8_THEPD|nr:ornithine cyclodeaminase [Thermofilum pendens]ABL77618.1 L-alanine dehydrogenase [Thermofilum pendens Hrk 5]